MGVRTEISNKKLSFVSRGPDGVKTKVKRFISLSFSVMLFSSFSLFLTLCVILLTSPSFAEQKTEQKTEQKNEHVPTIITSESLTADNKAKTALFVGSVVAKKGDMTLNADRMLVYYSEGGNGSNIDKIDADGNVKLVRGDRVITSGKAVYYAGADERAIFTESPRAAEGKNLVIGTKMTYYMKDDRYIVENSTVYMEKEQNSPGKKPQDKNRQ